MIKEKNDLKGKRKRVWYGLWGGWWGGLIGV